MEELIFILDEKKIDIASINETFLKSKHKITIPGYKIIRKDCSTGQGRGVALIVKNHTHVKKVGHTLEFLFWHLLMNLKNK